ncbi:hypothetical protein NJB1604_23640 [Mycobacterium marinum]|nr:hypothetical protein NJB1604_23640 [Mycobacterium marinum]
MPDYSRLGDTVVVAAIDRLGCFVTDVARTITDLSENRILLSPNCFPKAPGPHGGIWSAYMIPRAPLTR